MRANPVSEQANEQANDRERKKKKSNQIAPFDARCFRAKQCKCDSQSITNNMRKWIYLLNSFGLFFFLNENETISMAVKLSYFGSMRKTL